MFELLSDTYGWTLDYISTLTVPQIRVYLHNLYQRHASGHGLALSPIGMALKAIIGGDHNQSLDGLSSDQGDAVLRNVDKSNASEFGFKMKG